MQIGIFAVGRLKSGPEKELVARYLDRLKKTGKAELSTVRAVTSVTQTEQSWSLLI